MASPVVDPSPSFQMLVLMFATGWVLGRRPGATRLLETIGTDSTYSRKVVVFATVLEVVVLAAVLAVLLPVVVMLYSALVQAIL